MLFPTRWFNSTAPTRFALPLQVELWWVALDDFPSESYLPLLAPDEIARAARFHFDRDRHHYIVGRGVLRTLLGQYLEQPPAHIAIGYSPHHKPMLASGPLHFNIAHSGGLALMAFCAAAPVGVDVEAHRADVNWREIVPLVYTPAEQTWLFAHPPAEQFTRFYTLWARKEAFLKARGDGLIGDPANVTLLPHSNGAITPIPPEPSMAWVVQDVIAPSGFSAAVCYVDMTPP